MDSPEDYQNAALAWLAVFLLSIAFNKCGKYLDKKYPPTKKERQIEYHEKKLRELRK